MRKVIYHHGKILLSGEYLILDGAWGLALPTQKGQQLDYHILENEQGKLFWKSYDESNALWVEAVFEIPNIRPIFSTNPVAINFLEKLLKSTQALSSYFLRDKQGIGITTHLEFSPFWGLGSSATLICNLSKIAHISPYELLWNVAKGSGYDIACVLEEKPILYKVENQTPHIIPSFFSPPFKDKLFFLYLEKKKNTKEAISFYEKKKIYLKEQIIQEISIISKALLSVKSLDDFERLLELHEEILSKTLKMPTLKQKLFSQYKGLIKSLGGWGGDFALISYREGMKSYFLEKGYSILIPFKEMIL